MKAKILPLIVILIISGCSILPWVKDINNISDWISLPTDGNEYRYNTRTKYYDGGDWHDASYTIEITDIDEKSDAILIETRYNDSSDRDYIIIDKEEQAIALSGDDYFDEYDDFVILKTPVEPDNEWNTDDYEFTIDEVGVKKEVEAGIFNDCIVITYTDTGETGEIWYSPSAGTFIYEDYTTDSGYESITELERIRE